ncbi:MAG: amino acid ABC transporter permease [Eubacterium sp.]|nr:amino acid ABC transporter permease [Eubacterium sp.]
MFDFEFVGEAFPKVMGALPTTLFLTFASCIISLIFGLILALLIIYRVPVLRHIAAFFISYIRGTPLVVMLYIIYAALPLIIRNFAGAEAAYSIPPMVYAVIAYGINQSAFMAEMYRSALESVDAGQMEACLSIGMTTSQAMRRVIIPQAAVVAIPNFTNIFLMLFKGTSLAFTVTVVDIMAQAKIEASNGLRFIESYLLVAVIYWVFCIFFERVLSHLEKKLKR